MALIGGWIICSGDDFFFMVCDESDRWVDCLLRFFLMIFCDGLMV